jgi:hypothetical protein
MKLLCTVDLYTAEDAEDRLERAWAMGLCVLERPSYRKR